MLSLLLLVENFVQLLFIIMSFALLLMSLTVRNKSLPKLLKDLFYYGKCQRDDGATWAYYLKFPKKYFAHFYIAASIYGLIVLLIYCILLGYSVKFAALENLVKLIKLNKNKHSDHVGILLSLVLINIHVWQRCHECLHVSVFSNVNISVTHYLVGFLHYFGVFTGLLIEGYFTGNELNVAELGLHHYLGTVLCIAFMWKQFCICKLMANLRKDCSGLVVSMSHVMPTGDLFEFVSCPHYLMEILIYVSICLILKFNNMTWWCITIWVIVNQVIAASMSHNWYREKFDDYPVNRRAIIPFLF